MCDVMTSDAVEFPPTRISQINEAQGGTGTGRRAARAVIHALLLLGACALSQGCLTNALWKANYKLVTNQTLDARVDGLFEACAPQPGEPGRIIVRYILDTPDLADREVWNDVRGPDGDLLIEAAETDSRRFARQVTEAVLEAGDRIQSVELSLPLDAGENGKNEMTLRITLRGEEDHSETRTFVIQGTWRSIESVETADGISLIDTWQWPTTLRLMRDQAESNNLALVALTPFTVVIDTAVVATAMAASTLGRH